MSSPSEILSRSRSSLAQRHPRWTAGLWFGSLGVAACCLAFHTVYPHENLRVLIAICSSVAFCFYGWCGATKGAVILTDDTMTAKRAANVGTTIVPLAHLYCGAVVSFGLTLASPVLGLGFLVAILIVFGILLLLLIGGSFITFPLSGLGAVALYKYARRGKPQGCALHGYRDV